MNKRDNENNKKEPVKSCSLCDNMHLCKQGFRSELIIVDKEICAVCHAHRDKEW